MAAPEHVPEPGAEAVVQPRVEEGVAAGRAHGAQVAQQLDEQEVALVNEPDVDVSQHVEHVDGEPTHGEGRHQERHQAEDPPLTGSVGPVARRHALPQLDGDAQVRREDGRQRQDVGEQQGAVGVRAPLPVLAQPELLADGEALGPELHVVGVRERGSHEAAGQQPDAGEDGGAGSHGGALLQGANCGVISATGTEQHKMTPVGTFKDAPVLMPLLGHELEESS